MGQTIRVEKGCGQLVGLSDAECQACFSEPGPEDYWQQNPDGGLGWIGGPGRVARSLEEETVYQQPTISWARPVLPSVPRLPRTPKEWAQDEGMQMLLAEGLQWPPVALQIDIVEPGNSGSPLEQAKVANLPVAGLGTSQTTSSQVSEALRRLEDRSRRTSLRTAFGPEIGCAPVGVMATAAAIAVVPEERPLARALVLQKEPEILSPLPRPEPELSAGSRRFPTTEKLGLRRAESETAALNQVRGGELAGPSDDSSSDAPEQAARSAASIAFRVKHRLGAAFGMSVQKAKSEPPANTTSREPSDSPRANRAKDNLTQVKSEPPAETSSREPSDSPRADRAKDDLPLVAALEPLVHIGEQDPSGPYASTVRDEPPSGVKEQGLSMQGHNEWEVILEKTEDKKSLGMVLTKTSDNELVVRKVKEGLVEDWNARNPDRAVQEGDTVIAANSVSDSYDKIMKTMKDSTMLKLTFRRKDSRFAGEESEERAGYTSHTAAPSGDSREAAAQISDVARIAALIRGVYSRKCPEKLKDVSRLMQSWAGQEQELYEKVCAKYGEAPRNISDASDQVQRKSENPMVTRGGEESTDVGGAEIEYGSLNVTLDKLLPDLEGAEDVVFAKEFLHLGGGSPLKSNSQALLGFLAGRTALKTHTEMERGIRKVVKASPEVNQAEFARVLRDNAIPDSTAMAAYMDMTTGLEDVDPARCRDVLMEFGKRHVRGASELTEATWARLLDATIPRSSKGVNMSQWCIYCQRMARAVRIMTLLGLS